MERGSGGFEGGYDSGGGLRAQVQRGLDCLRFGAIHDATEMWDYIIDRTASLPDTAGDDYSFAEATADIAQDAQNLMGDCMRTRERLSEAHTEFAAAHQQSLGLFDAQTQELVGMSEDTSDKHDQYIVAATSLADRAEDPAARSRNRTDEVAHLLALAQQARTFHGEALEGISLTILTARALLGNDGL